MRSSPCQPRWPVLLQVVALVALAGCDGELGDPVEPVPGPPDVEPKEVPADLEQLASTATCAARAEGERVLSVSPEGHLWLVTDGAPTRVRVLDAFGDELVETERELDVPTVVDGQAWSGVDASLVAEGQLLQLQDFARLELTPPAGMPASATLCGDPSRDGALVAQGQVFERRADAWWQWSPAETGSAAPSAALRFDGACWSSDDLLWLTAADGTLFRVEPALYTRPVRFEGVMAAAATDGLLAVLDRDGLYTAGADLAWQPWTFAAGAPSALSASAGALWVLSGEHLLRFDGETWVEITHGANSPPEALAAHPGGVWLLSGDEVCHQSLGPTLRVEGLRSYGRSADLERPFRVLASDGAPVSAQVDGAPLELTPDVDGWLSAMARLDAVGWHEIVLEAGGARRTLRQKRLPEQTRGWQADVEPIYAASCTGSTCHGDAAADAPELGTYEAFVERASAVRTRVVEARTMPPAANVGPDWGEDDVQVIAEWLEGGMLP